MTSKVSVNCDRVNNSIDEIIKDLEEYEIAKNLIHELRIILYGDDEYSKTDFDIIKKCQLKILQYLEDKAKRLKTEKLIREELENKYVYKNKR